MQEANERLSIPNVALLFTDGESSDRDRAVYEAYLSKEAGIDIIAIGIGDWVVWNELEAMVSFPKTRNTMHIPNYNVLFRFTDMAISAMCNGEFDLIYKFLLWHIILFCHFLSTPGPLTILDMIL